MWSNVELKLVISFPEELREHFSKYGDIESINVKTDPNTGRSRGFAFIVFSLGEAVDKVGSYFVFNEMSLIVCKIRI